MATAVRTGSYLTAQANILPNVYPDCSKSRDVYIPPYTTKEVMFLVGGVNDDKKRTIKFIVSNSNFSLSTSQWSAENAWRIKTKITNNKPGEAYIQVQVEGQNKNTIRLISTDEASVSDKDVFTKKEIDRLIAENQVSLSKGTACIIATDRQLGKLLANDKDFMTDKSNNGADVNTAYTRIAQIKAKGFVRNFKDFPASTLKGSGYYKPTAFSSGNERAISSYLEAAVGNKNGYHVFYFTILDGYHVLTLVIDAWDLCNMKYKIYDQLKERGAYKDFKEIDQGLLDMNTNNYDLAASLTRDKTVSTKFGIWKIQKR
jgi:hypothetical protein